MTKKKTKDLLIITLIYIIAYCIGFIFSKPFDSVLFKFFMFDIIATVVTFIFSVIFKNSSVYDAYWSLTPMIMSVWLFYTQGALSLWHIIFLLAFNLWSLRLTVNWVIVFTDFNYEDWRYRKFRDENSTFMWWIINFFGIHLVPTLVVFLGMLPLFDIVRNDMNGKSLIGISIILIGTALEFYADRDMHSFLQKAPKGEVCKEGLWKYSRHPNYLGEITVWLGVFASMLPLRSIHYSYSIGFISVAILFNVVSIPLMEKRQLARRHEYADYKHSTSRLLILPERK